MQIEDIDINEVVELSKTKSYKDVAIELGCRVDQVGKLLRSKGISLPRNRLNLSKLYFDDCYFDNIDEPRKAYWLGYLASDGCLKNNKVVISSADYDHILKFKHDLKSEHKLSTYSHVDRITNTTSIVNTLSITSCYFRDKLTKYIPIDKTDTFKLPDIPKEYYRDLIAGMMDADGSFGLNKYSKNATGIRANLISTKECLEEIQNYIFKELSIPITKLFKVTPNNNVWKLHIYKGAVDFLNFIYHRDDKSIYLNRKVGKLKSILQFKLDNPNKIGLRRKIVYVYDTDGKHLNTFNSVTECIDFYNISTSTFYRLIKNNKNYNNIIFKTGEYIKY